MKTSTRAIIKDLASTNKAHNRCKATSLGGLWNAVDTTMSILNSLIDFSSNKEMIGEAYNMYTRNLSDERKA